MKTITAGFFDAPWVFVFLSFVFMYLQLVIRELSLTIGTDAATYILLAKAMAAGGGYVDVSIPGSPAHTQYPPLFPLMLTPVFYLFGFSFAWMRLIEVLSGLACVYLKCNSIEGCFVGIGINEILSYLAGKPREWI